MKLYDGGRAPNPRRVTIFLSEKGVEIEIIPVDMGQLGHKSKEISALNPLQRLPVLELDDGAILTESVAICRYVEALHPEPNLFGLDPLEQAKVEMWNRRMELNFLAAVTAVFRHTHPAMKDWEVPQVPDWGQSNRDKAVQFLHFLDDELAGRAYIAGGRFTIADITGIVALNFMKPAKIELPAELANVARWREAVASRPSVKG